MSTLSVAIACNKRTTILQNTLAVVLTITVALLDSSMDIVVNRLAFRRRLIKIKTIYD